MDRTTPGADEWVIPEEQKKQIQWFAPAHQAKVLSYVRARNSNWLPVYDVANPLPSLTQQDISLQDGGVLIEIPDVINGNLIRPLHWTEAARAVGLREQDLQGLLERRVPAKDIWKM